MQERTREVKFSVRGLDLEKLEAAGGGNRHQGLRKVLEHFDEEGRLIDGSVVFEPQGPGVIAMPEKVVRKPQPLAAKPAYSHPFLENLKPPVQTAKQETVSGLLDKPASQYVNLCERCLRIGRPSCGACEEANP